MKKIITLVLFIAISAGFVAPKNSEAGIIVIASGAAFDDGEEILAPVAVSFGAGMLIVWAAGKFLYHSNRPILGITGGLLLALDADASLDQDALTQALEDNYPFINNHAATTELSSVIKSKVPKKRPAKMLVSISRTEIENALAAADLKQKEIELIVKDLE